MYVTVPSQGNATSAEAAAAAVASVTGSLTDHGHGSTSTSSWGHVDSRLSAAHGATTSSSEIQAHTRMQAPSQPQGQAQGRVPVPRQMQLQGHAAAGGATGGGPLGSHSVPTRSSSACINHDEALGLQTMQSQSPLFANWPMSDGALQGMQLIDPHEATGLDAQHFSEQVPGMRAQTADLQGARQGLHQLGSVQQPEKPPDSTGAVPSREFFPHWSTQF